MSRHCNANRRQAPRFWISAIIALLAFAGVHAAYGAGTTAKASCTGAPSVSYTDTTAKITSVCTIPLPPAPPASTVTATATPTVSASPSSSTPSSSPVPTPTSSTPAPLDTGCIPSPSACGWPDTGTTGPDPSITLKASSSLTITTAGTYSGLNVNGCVTISTPGVVFKDSIVHGTGCRAVVYVTSAGKGAVIDHVEIDGSKSNTDGPDPGLYGFGFTATALDIHDTGDGVDAETGDVLTDSYIHDLRTANGSHTDGVQVTGATGITLRHNTILADGANEGIIIGADLGNISNVVADRNIIDGGNNGVVAGNNPGYTATGITFSNNRFGRTAQYGPCNFNAKMTFTGNVWDDTGKTLSC